MHIGNKNIDNNCDYYDPSGVKELLNQEQNNVSLFCLNTIQYIAIPITHVINQSLLTGTVPRNMKTAKVIPIFK